MQINEDSTFIVTNPLIKRFLVCYTSNLILLSFWFIKSLKWGPPRCQLLTHNRLFLSVFNITLICKHTFCMLRCSKRWFWSFYVFWILKSYKRLWPRIWSARFPLNCLTLTKTQQLLCCLSLQPCSSYTLDILGTCYRLTFTNVHNYWKFVFCHDYWLWRVFHFLSRFLISLNL